MFWKEFFSFKNNVKSAKLLAKLSYDTFYVNEPFKDGSQASLLRLTFESDINSFEKFS